MKALVLGALVMAALLAGATGASAESPQDAANDISAQVMSPFCPGVTLGECPSQEAVDLRNRIATWAGRGDSRATIMNRLVAQYGPQVRAAPPKSGTGLAAWAAPAVAVLAGASVLLWLLVRWSRARASGAGEPEITEITGEDRARLDAELASWRAGREGADT